MEGKEGEGREGKGKREKRRRMSVGRGSASPALARRKSSCTRSPLFEHLPLYAPTPAFCSIFFPVLPSIHNASYSPPHPHPILHPPRSLNPTHNRKTPKTSFTPLGPIFLPSLFSPPQFSPSLETDRQLGLLTYLPAHPVTLRMDLF